MSSIKLKYQGKGDYLMNVPARDLSQLDLEQIAAAAYNNLGYADTVPAVIAILTSRGLYTEHEEYLCPDCGKAYKTWDGYSNHVMTAHVTAPEISDEHGNEIAEDDRS